MPHAVSASRHDLTAQLHRAGYYPELVADVIDIALADEEVVAHLVQPETTFDSEVRRHLTVLVLTPTRLVTAHVDDHTGEDPARPGSASATTEVVPVREIRSVALTHVIADPAQYPRRGATREVTLAVGWGAVSRVDLEPASCVDPNCTADHGLTGQVTPDDVVVRVSGEAEGDAAVRAAVDFAKALSRATSA